MIRRLIASLSIALLCLIAVPASAAAWNPFQTVCSGSGTTSNSAVCGPDSKPANNPISGSHGILMNAVNIIAFVAGIAAVILIIVAGLKYVTANGDSNSINSAKNTIIYALIGIVIIIAGRSIIAFAVGKI